MARLKTVSTKLSPTQLDVLEQLRQRYGVKDEAEVLRIALAQLAAGNGINWHDLPEAQKGRGGDRKSKNWRKIVPPNP